MGRLVPAGGCVWERDFAAFAGGGVAGVESFHDDEAVFAGGLELFFAADAAGEMRELLRRAVIPEFFEDGIGPTFCGGRFFDGVAVAVFAVGGHGVAHVEIGVAAAVASPKTSILSSMPPRRAQLFSMRALAPFSNSTMQSTSSSALVLSAWT